jgi:hypothetical protein
VIESTAGILKLIEDGNKGEFTVEDDYMNLYQKIMGNA